MEMRTSLIVVLVFSVLLSACSFVKKMRDPGAGSAQKLMLKSGLDKQIEQYPAMIRAALLQGREKSLQNYTDEEFEKIIRLADTAFSSVKLKEIVQRSLSANLSEADINAALDWLNSPLGEKITKLEEAASTPEALAESQQSGSILAGDQGRVALIRELDQALKSSETAKGMAKYTSAAFLMSVFAEYPREYRPSAEAIMAVAEKNAEDNRPAFEQLALYLELYGYRTLSNSDIKQYIEFAQSPGGERYTAIGHAALNEAMLLASRDFGTELGKIIMERTAAGNQSAIESVNESQ